MQFLESSSRPQRFLSPQDEETGTINIEFSDVSWLYPQWQRVFWLEWRDVVSLKDLDKIEYLFCCSKKSICILVEDYASKHQEMIIVCKQLPSKDKACCWSHGINWTLYIIFWSYNIEAIFNSLPDDYGTFISVKSESEGYIVEEIESNLLTQ